MSSSDYINVSIKVFGRFEMNGFYRYEEDHKKFLAILDRLLVDTRQPEGKEAIHSGDVSTPAPSVKLDVTGLFGEKGK